MFDLDIILDMTWLYPYYIIMDCNAKIVPTKIPDRDKLEWEGVYRSKMVRIISFVGTKASG